MNLTALRTNIQASRVLEQFFRKQSEDERIEEAEVPPGSLVAPIGFFAPGYFRQVRHSRK